MTQLVTITNQPKPYALLVPVDAPVRNIGVIVDPSCWSDALAQVLRTSPEDVVALDFETRGTDPTLPGNHIVGMGLASKRFNYYFHRVGHEAAFDGLIRRMLDSPLRFIAHNAYFDGSWIFHVFGDHLNWEACTYAWYRHLATEGWTGQKWGLKDAQMDLLGWPESNDGGIIEWLENAGHVNGSGKANKAEMWRCPPDILGEYCLLDAESTYLLYVNVLEPALRRFPDLQQYLAGPELNLIRVLIEQKLAGMEVDREQLLTARDEIYAELGPLEHWILNESDAAPHIREWERLKWQEFRETEPAPYLTKKLGQEPPRTKKDGTPSKVWIKWAEKRDTPPVVSKNWIAWSERAQKIRDGVLPGYKFNLRSGDHLRWLFFDRMECTPLEMTESGLPSADTDSLSKFGPAGSKLAEYLGLHKELGFVDAYLTLTDERSTIHPGFRVPGTYTGRLSGVEPNIQQVPKSRRFLSALRARPGYVWIDADFTSLEPVVCTELSGDAELMSVFGPAAPAGSDIYLHTGVGLPQFRDQIIAAGYDPDRLTKEGATNAKKECKQIRQICKVLYLSSSYGAGAKKIHKTLTMQGVDISLSDVEDMHAAYWQYYAGIKHWERYLKDQLRKNRGWVMNGIGRPIGVHKDYERDVVNRVVQSTGHDLLVKYIHILTQLLNEAGFDWTPIVMDFHDEVIIEVPESAADGAVLTFREAQDRLNVELGGTIPLRINPVVVNNLAEAKIEG